jgi:hypothetical protein
MTTNPEPPFLVIREGKSFWVESRPLNECSATLQAFREGCFRDACCYDATGGVWPILSAQLKERPSLAQRLLPWRRVAVQLRIGARSEADLKALLSQLAVVLQSEGEFCESLAVPPNQILQRLETARTPSDAIRIACECA